MSHTAAALALILLVLLAHGCAGRRTRAGASTWREEGVASWYGTDFHGRRTANGERYNMYAMTAAHRTLPLGTSVLVTHRDTGRRVRVRINDRGPFVAGRIIDLSYSAARQLGSADAGVAPVILEASLPAVPAAPPATPATPSTAPTPATTGFFCVQAGAFSSPANAQRLRAELLPEYIEVRVVIFEDNRGVWHRVRAGRFATEEQAVQAARRLEARGLTPFVVRED